MKFLHAALLIIFTAQFAVLLYALYTRRRQKREQDSIVEGLRGSRFWRVAISRPDHLKTLWKINTIQALAVLIDEGDDLRLRGSWSSGGEDFNMIIPRQSARVSLDENSSLTAGNLAWLRLQRPDGDLMMAADTGLNAANSREALVDLVRNAFPAYPLDAKAGADFALDKNRRSMIVVVLFFLLLAFAALDTYVFSGYELIDSQFVQLLVNPTLLIGGTAVFVTVVVLTYRHLVAGKVPARESLALSALLLAAIALAAFPALKRIDQVLAANISLNYKYTVVDSVVHLAPVDASQGLPQLRFARAPEYWAQFPVGSEVTIPLLHGPIGLWQLDHARFDPPILSFYDKLEKK